HDDQAGRGHGFVDQYNTRGVLIRRIARRGRLNSPWGLAIAPDGFGRFAGMLLVGNFGDGRITAFKIKHNDDDEDIEDGGQVRGLDGRALQIEGLWALIPGNGGSGGSAK